MKTTCHGKLFASSDAVSLLCFPSLLLILLFASPVASLALTLDKVYPNHNGSKVYVEYSEPVCKDLPSTFFGATHIPNYSFAPSTTIQAATPLSDNRTVMLDLSPPLNGSCTLTVNAQPGAPITSCSSNVSLATPVSKSFSVEAGCITPKVYEVIPRHIGTDCGLTLTAIGCGFDALATMTLYTGPSAPVSGFGVGVNGEGEITATFPSGLLPGLYDLVVANPPIGTVFPGLSTSPYSISVETPELQKAWPNNVPDCSSVMISAYGHGICPGATFTAKQHGGAAVVTGTELVILSSGDLIKGVFVFSTSPAGSLRLDCQQSRRCHPDVTEWGVCLWIVGLGRLPAQSWHL